MRHFTHAVLFGFEQTTTEVYFVRPTGDDCQLGPVCLFYSHLNVLYSFVLSCVASLVPYISYCTYICICNNVAVFAVDQKQTMYSRF